MDEATKESYIAALDRATTGIEDVDIRIERKPLEEYLNRHVHIKTEGTLEEKIKKININVYTEKLETLKETENFTYLCHKVALFDAMRNDDEHYPYFKQLMLEIKGGEKDGDIVKVVIIVDDEVYNKEEYKQ